jgi:hypothetical protein
LAVDRTVPIVDAVLDAAVVAAGAAAGLWRIPIPYVIAAALAPTSTTIAARAATRRHVELNIFLPSVEVVFTRARESAPAQRRLGVTYAGPKSVRGRQS